MKKSELRELVREQVRKLVSEANISQEAWNIHTITQNGSVPVQDFIDDNKLDAKKLLAYAIQHRNSKEKYELRDIIAGTGIGANVSVKNRFLKQFQESVVTEGDMTRQYDGFIVLDSKTKKTYKFKYIKGSNNVNVENIAIAKLMKSTGSPRANFAVHGFVRKGQWDADKTAVFTETVLKETFIGPFVFTASTPDKELIAMYHGALDGYSNYKTGMKFSKAEYKLAYQTIEKILQKKGVAITEASITEAKEYSFTFDYNTEPDDIEYIENLLKKARVNAYAEQGTFDDEMVIKAGDAIELRKAKKAIEADGFDINEADDPEAGEAAPYGSGYSKVNEAIDIHNDESAMKALEDIAVNMTKWKGSEGAHYTDLLEKVIDFLKYGNHRTN
jgi:hypothetical protein